ncbi:sugar ABC transporter permease [Weissella sagaensis]|jgi:arabinogalactan oligomer/maltooligosaccharide transport system permease protein|uniref:sugar ABC transporter permease n=1 Tax=Weissella sagaensis TaxID=2559928 RepID=UPI0005A6E47A|nr:sugar ABC transporter permease [Weissella sagaensis]KAA8435093.1 sugar ABC transporter permease [Weissella paramesenteroides]MBU7568604.1 sugar ABC transporter permease [Weissella hellenica]KAA8438984.1 sugar ABC transporter permease [Weissella paramesenteroides]QDJ58404.1 sugar ABC transporter permease [Weissella hellenica]QEA57398.1 sugar ABC transporter permease [Weissella hellenica]
MKNKNKRTRMIVYTILTLLAVVWVLPIIWIVLTSFRSEGGMFVDYFIPHHFTLDNYKMLFTNSTYPFGRWFMNTLIVAVVSATLSTFITVVMAYSLSRLKFRWRGRFLQGALVLNMFPGFMSMIAIYYILKAIGLTQSLVALILVYVAGAALGFYVQKGFFDTIPISLDESAMLDGATKWDIFRTITLPLSKPIIVYTTLMAFTGPWMDFIFARVIMGDNIQNYTVAIGLYTMMTRESANSLFMAFAAGSVLIAVPITILFIALQRFFVEGMTSGAVKG